MVNSVAPCSARYGTTAAEPSAGEIVCLPDALDKCRESEREKLIDKLSRLHSVSTKPSAKLKFLVTSRPYHDIESAFYGAIDDLHSISLPGEHESDIFSKELNLVIDHQIPRIRSALKFPLQSKAQNVLIEKLKSTPHRTYL